MPSRLKFSHKILLAASLVVIATFALFVQRLPAAQCHPRQSRELSR